MTLKIPGTFVKEPKLSELRENVQKLLKSDSNPRRFPGAQPISFAASHIDSLINNNYFVSEKADGIRCLFFTRELKDGNVETYLIDRKNDFYRHNFGLPLPGGKKPHRNTILDGELVIEKRSGGVEKLMFLFFDALVVDGKLLIDRNYLTRLGYFREFVMVPYIRNCEKRGKSYVEMFPFEMRQKRVLFSYQMKFFFETEYRHKNDGLMFTSTEDPYTLGTCKTMLKWKPSEENTVDFKLLRKDDFKYHMMILVNRDEYRDFGELVLEPELEQEWSSSNMDGRIVECRWDEHWPNNWRFYRLRDDKLDSNHISVYENILRSISDNVTKEQLLDAVPDIYSAWKERDPSIKPLKKDTF